VEANEALRRIVMRHRLLLVVCMLLPTLAVIATYKKKAPTFSATARIQAQTVQPSSDTEADAILNRAKAVATSLDVVKAAVAKAQLPRNPAVVAAHNIAASRLSSSAVVSLTVTDPTRAGAISLAEALAPKVVDAINQLSLQQTAPLVAQVDQQRDALTKNRIAIADQLNKNLTAPGAPVLSSELQSIDNTLATLLAQRQQLLVTGGSTGSAAVIDVPTTAKGVSSGLKTRAILGLVVGLVLGLLTSTVDELLRPTVSRPATFGHELGVPLLGTLRAGGPKVADLDQMLLPTLEAAAARAGVCTLVLMGPVPDEVLFAVAGNLDDELASADHVGVKVTATMSTAAVNGWTLRVTERAAVGGGKGSGRSFPTPALVAGSRKPDHAVDRGGDHTAAASGIQVVALPAIRSHDRSDGFGLVAVAPNFAPYGALAKVADMKAATGWPLLGVIGNTGRRHRMGLFGRGHDRQTEQGSE
jgi:capsular polysaccharide biosynthesis protein